MSPLFSRKTARAAYFSRGKKGVGERVFSLAEDLKQAVELKVNYAFAGHIFATDSKKGLAPKGVGFLKE